MTKELNELKELIMVVDQGARDSGDFFGVNEKKSPSKLAKLYHPGA